MGRVSLVVPKAELEKVVVDLETNTTFDSQGALFEAVANSAWGKAVQNEKRRVKGISASMVGQKVREYKIPIKTQSAKGKGKKVNKNRADKLAENPITKVVADNIKKREPEISANLVDRAMQGKLGSILRLRCVRCHGGENTYKTCNDTSCESLPINLIMFPRKETIVKI